MFADDTTILADTVTGLQAGLQVLDEYCQHWGVTVNIDKTKVVVFKKGGRVARDEKWNYRNKDIDVVNCFKYLGIVFAQSGKFNMTQQTLADQAIKTLFTLKRYTNKFVNLSPIMSCQLFDVFIAPILNYASEVWGFHSACAVEKVHLKYLKHLLCVKNTVPNMFVYGEFGRYPMLINRKVRILSYWCKLLCQPEGRYTRYVYTIMYEQVERQGVVNWASLVRDLLFSLGMGHAWYQQSVGCKKKFISEATQRLKDQFIQNWHSQLTDMSRARSYR